MIQIHYKMDAQGRPERILITGHAEYSEYGTDIVCAAVSAVSIGLVNAIEKLTGVVVHQPDDGEGKIDCRRPKQVQDPEVQEKIALLMEAMLLSLMEIAEGYPAYVQLKQL